jgi:hypothetical protein
LGTYYIRYRSWQVDTAEYENDTTWFGIWKFAVQTFLLDNHSLVTKDIREFTHASITRLARESAPGLGPWFVGVGKFDLGQTQLT